ncbi:MAG: F0F1 ATP synthase subunit B [Candidatus Competibacterales bacterium]|nr:F0F1 ATP synthase subunit B [Candidatus Competibacterales bacterium]
MTLIGQGITFFIFIFVTMKYVWPPIVQAMQEREKRIADGLAAAERGEREQELAEAKAVETLRDAKQQAQEIIRQAEKRASDIVEQSKQQAREEGEKQLAVAQAEIDQEMNRAREKLRTQVADIAVAGAGRVLGKEIDATSHQKLLDDLVAQL